MLVLAAGGRHAVEVVRARGQGAGTAHVRPYVCVCVVLRCVGGCAGGCRSQLTATQQLLASKMMLASKFLMNAIKKCDGVSANLCCSQCARMWGACTRVLKCAHGPMLLRS